MIARGFKPVAWVAAIGAAALSCYMLSLRVAAERAELGNLDQRIVATRQEIRALQTELGTRGRLQQLEEWNSELLALSAPASGQYLDSNLQLARFDVRQRGLDEQAAEVRLAAAEAGQGAQPGTAQPGTAPRTAAPVPSAPPTAAPAAPRVVLASARPPEPAKPTPEALPTVRRASLAVVERPVSVPVPAQRRAAAPASERPVTATRPASAPARPGSLLGDNVLRDLRDEARAERAGGTRN